MVVLRSQRGFTLLEVLLTLVVAVMVLSAVSFSFDKLQAAMSYRNGVHTLLSALKKTRNAARREGVATDLRIDIAGGEYRIADGKPQPLRDDLQYRLVTGLSEKKQGLSQTETEQQGFIRFYPDGSASGGSITIARPGGQGVRLRVDWLLGSISQEPV